MRDWQDYYSLLQVHHRAEICIVESAYKRLSKKYHPDLNKNKQAEEIMKKLNRAYEVLKDPKKREAYHKVWLMKNPGKAGEETGEAEFDEENVKAAACASLVLSNYLLAVSDKKFTEAYEFISDYDKKNISIEEFAEWQTAASRLFEIGKFKLEVFRSYYAKEFINIEFERAIEFNAEVDEKNIPLGRIQKSEAIRTAVFENNKWKVFLGYESVKPFTDRLNLIEKDDFVRQEMELVLNTKEKFDLEMGLLNMKGFLEEAEKEIERNSRYNSSFSIIICCINNLDYIRNELGNGAVQSAIKQTGRVLTGNLRKIDVVSLLERKTFCLLLPETNAASVEKVIKKLSDITAVMTLYYEEKGFNVGLSLGTAEYGGSIEETIKIAYGNMLKKEKIL